MNPNLPENFAISFYIQSYKLVLAVYQLESTHGSVKYDSQQAECSIPWLNDALVLLTVSLQLCQRLKDKVILHFYLQKSNDSYKLIFLFNFRSVYFLSIKILLLVVKCFTRQKINNN